MQNKLSYSEAVKQAENSVKEISDVKLKLIAFETILKDILSNKITSETKDMNPATTTVSEIKSSLNTSSSTLLIKFSSMMGIKPEEVGLVYNVNEDKKSCRIVSDFQHNFGKWSQINFVLLRLFGNYIISGSKKALSLPIIREMKDYGYGGLPNINAFMKTISPSIVHVNTKNKKSENTYELTEFGINPIKKLISEIILHNGIVPSESSYLPNKVSKRKSKSQLVMHILDQLEDGFFDKPKTINSLKEKLTEKGQYYERSIIDEKIRRRFLNKELKRLRIDKVWNYVKK